MSWNGWGILDNYKINKCSDDISAQSETAAGSRMETVQGISLHLKRWREPGGSFIPGWESISRAALCHWAASAQLPSSLFCARNDAQGKITAPGVFFPMGFGLSREPQTLFWVGNVVNLSVPCVTAHLEGAQLQGYCASHVDLLQKNHSLNKERCLN